MRIAILIKIVYCMYNETLNYETIDKFIELNDDDENIETKIMKKYPTLNIIGTCYDCDIVVEQITKEKYLIVTNTI